MIEPEEESHGLKLYLSERTVTAIQSRIRIEILSLIRDEGEVSFSRIMEYTGRSKATVSVHVNSLVEAGLIAESPVPGDARKKNYVLTSSHLGDIVPHQQTGVNEFRELIRQCYIKYDNVDYRQIIPHIIQVSLMEAGVRIDPIMIRGGEILGESVSSLIVSETLEKTVDNIVKFWARYSLGNVRVRSYSPLQLEIYDCYECMVLPKQERCCCFISLGILTAFFKAYYRREVEVKEIECMVQGYPACCMEIVVPERSEVLPEYAYPGYGR